MNYFHRRGLVRSGAIPPRVLHLFDSPQTGGATVAAQSVINAVCTLSDPWIQKQDPPTKWEEAYRAVGVYCDRRVGRWLDEVVTPMPDLLALHNFRDWGTGCIAWAKRHGIPVVWHALDYWPINPLCITTEPFKWWLYQPAKGRRHPLVAKLPLIGRQSRVLRWFNQLDAIVVLSEHSKGVLQQAGITRPAYHVVPVPMTVPKRLKEWDTDDTFEPTRNPNLVLYVGGKSAHKGWNVWQEIARLLLRVEGRLLACKFLQQATRSQTLGEIARAACLVVPEMWPNPGPVVIAEAQLLGTPVVASNIGGIPEMNPRWLANPGDPEDFVAQIIDAIDNGPTPVSATGGRYDAETIRRQLQEVYRSCCSR